MRRLDGTISYDRMGVLEHFMTELGVPGLDDWTRPSDSPCQPSLFLFFVSNVKAKCNREWISSAHALHRSLLCCRPAGTELHSTLLFFLFGPNTSHAKHHWQAFAVGLQLSHTPLHRRSLWKAELAYYWQVFPIDLEIKQNNHFRAVQPPL